MPVVFGLALLPLVAVLGWYCLKDRVGAMLLVTFFSVETIFIVNSRTGVMDIFLVFLVLATFIVALRAESSRQVVLLASCSGWPSPSSGRPSPWPCPSATSWRKGLLRPFLGGLWISAVVYVAVVYVGALISVTANPLQAWLWVWDWHVKAASKISAAIPHGWGSPWWSWPIMLRPIRYFYGVNGEGLLQVVIAIGNPLIWWSGTLAVLAGIFDVARKAVSRKLSADDPMIPIVLGYVFFLVPWIPGTRIPYIYNYLPIYPFAILALAYWLLQALEPPAVGSLAGRRLRRLRRGAGRILPPPGHSAAHKRRRPHEPRVDRLLVPLRESGPRERLPGPEPHLSVPPVRLIRLRREDGVVGAFGPAP